jgi:hypothetical protein
MLEDLNNKIRECLLHAEDFVQRRHHKLTQNFAGII